MCRCALKLVFQNFWKPWNFSNFLKMWGLQRHCVTVWTPGGMAFSYLVIIKSMTHNVLGTGARRKTKTVDLTSNFQLFCGQEDKDSNNVFVRGWSICTRGNGGIRSIWTFQTILRWRIDLFYSASRFSARVPDGLKGFNGTGSDLSENTYIADA